MKIGLIDVDGHNWPSLPLMKISAYHKARGDEVEPWFPINHYDKVYMSKVFTGSADIDSVIYADEIERGGTGYFYPDGGPPLPEEIEHTFPDYGLYQATAGRAYGFLTRGCPRQCEFCIVGKKEGTISRQVADLSEFWNGQREIKLIDPNILACKERERLLQELADSGAWVDFTQGLDIRLIEGIEDLVTAIKIKRIHFAWDNPEQDLRPQFEDFKKKSGLTDYRRLGVYVLTNYNSSHEQDLYRVYTLRDLGYDPYVMVYEKETAPRETRLLQRWANNRIIFRSCPRFEDYDPRRG